jgi:hypothetical protein
MSRIRIQGLPGGCWCRPTREAGVTTAWVTPRVRDRAGDERGQHDGPPVHAVPVRHVLQLEGVSALLGALRTCVVSGTCTVVCYAPHSLLTHG